MEMSRKTRALSGPVTRSAEGRNDKTNQLDKSWLGPGREEAPVALPSAGDFGHEISWRVEGLLREFQLGD